MNFIVKKCMTLPVLRAWRFLEGRQLCASKRLRVSLLFFFSWRDSPLVGLGLLISRGLFFQITHNAISQSVGLPWTSDQLVAETSTWQHTTLTTDIHAPGGIRTHDLSRRAAVDLRLRPRGHWERLIIIIILFINVDFICHHYRYLCNNH